MRLSLVRVVEPVPGVPGVACCPAVPGPGPIQADRDRRDVNL